VSFRYSRVSVAASLGVALSLLAAFGEARGADQPLRLADYLGLALLFVAVAAVAQWRHVSHSRAGSRSTPR
jgi:hypothetical protein